MRRLRFAVAVVASLLAAIALAGCGLSFAKPASGPAAITRTQANELPTPPGAPERIRGARSGGGSAETAVRRFAEVYINWNAGDVGSRLRELAAGSVGQARSEMTLEVEQVKRDGSLRRGGIGNRGTVEAVSPLRDGGGARRFAVVTLERTTATNSDEYAGVGAGWHLTIASVERAPVAGGGDRRRWAVSEWQPES